MNLNEIIFLAEINGKEIEIVHPFFNDDTHHPITKTDGDYQLINLDNYGIAFDREVSVIVIKEKKIHYSTGTKITANNHCNKQRKLYHIISENIYL